MAALGRHRERMITVRESLAAGSPTDEELLDILHDMAQIDHGPTQWLTLPVYDDIEALHERPDPSNGSPVSLHLEVADCDAVAAAAVRNGARLDRGPESTSHGRSATFRDPFGHRWIVNS